MYIMVDKRESIPKMQAQVRSTKFREFCWPLSGSAKRINYVSSTDALEAKEQLTSLIRTKDSQSSLSYYQKMYQS